MGDRHGRVEQLREVHQLRRAQLEALKVKPGIAGVVQVVSVQVGQRVDPATILAKVARPEKLKAELKVPDSKAKDLKVGQQASVDTRNGVVKGKVARIDPRVQDGNVLVDIAFDQPLPAGARPDLSVEGSIELEKIPSVLYIRRPVQASSRADVALFRLESGSNLAQRVPVRLGRSSSSYVEVRSGLGEGDQVILSDMSAWDGVDSIRLQ